VDFYRNDILGFHLALDVPLSRGQNFCFRSLGGTAVLWWSTWNKEMQPTVEIRDPGQDVKAPKLLQNASAPLKL